MNNRERYIWIGVFVISAMFCDRKMAQVEGLEILNDHNKLNFEIQSEQINDLLLKIDSSESVGYDRGFEDGKAHAMIAAVHGENVYGYAEGYHAAVKQLSEEMSSEEIKGQVSQYIDNLMKKVNSRTPNK